MKEKILETLFQKISSEFKIEYPPFLRKEDYEKQLNDVKIHIRKQILDYKQEYDKIANSTEFEIYKSLIKLPQKEFIENNTKYFGYVNASTESEKELLYDAIINTRFEKSKLEILINSSWKYREYSEHESYVQSHWLISLLDYLVERKDDIINSSSNKSLCERIVRSILPKSSYSYRINDNLNQLLNGEEILENIIQYVNDDYLRTQGAFMNLLEIAEKYIQRENILPFSSWVLNVGTRDFYHSYNRTISKYKITNKGKEYSFEHKNDGKSIKDVFVNLFVLSNNELLKLSIGSSNLLQRTPYLISKDIQRVDITGGNVLELHMHKHFDPETIIFDTEDEAYKFQRKISELRELRRNPNTRK